MLFVVIVLVNFAVDTDVHWEEFSRNVRDKAWTCTGKFCLLSLTNPKMCKKSWKERKNHIISIGSYQIRILIIDAIKSEVAGFEES